MEKLGATGKFPHGKLCEDDEGEIQIAIGLNPRKGLVRIEFGKPVAWLALPPDEAEMIAKAILRKVDALKSLEVETSGEGN